MDLDTRFCWTELCTTDKEKAGRFYARLLGWDCIPQPVWTRSGLTIDYSLFTLRGQKVAGVYPMVGGQRKQSTRPHWMAYVFVADAADTAARARELGAALLAGPLDVYDLGRMAILRDPQGAPFGTWQPLRLGSGYQARHQPGCASWFEQVSDDVARSAGFYCALFGWERAPGTERSGRAVLELGGTPVAGCSPRAGRLAPQWLTFFQVAELETTCQKLASLEGTVIAPPEGAPGRERAAIACDPQGAAFGLVSPPPGRD